MEQQCKITQLTWEEFKPMFLNTPLHMRLGEGDLKHLEESEGTKFVILEATTADTTERRFKIAINGIYKGFKKYGLSPTSSWKGLFLVGYPNSCPITMVDMSYVCSHQVHTRILVDHPFGQDAPWDRYHLRNTWQTLPDHLQNLYPP